MTQTPHAMHIFCINSHTHTHLSKSTLSQFSIVLKILIGFSPVYPDPHFRARAKSLPTVKITAKRHKLHSHALQQSVYICSRYKCVWRNTIKRQLRSTPLPLTGHYCSAPFDIPHIDLCTSKPSEIRTPS